MQDHVSADVRYARELEIRRSVVQKDGAGDNRVQDSSLARSEAIDSLQVY